MLLRYPQLPRFLVFLNVKLLTNFLWTALYPSCTLYWLCRLLHRSAKDIPLHYVQRPSSQGQFLLLTVRETQLNQCCSSVLGLLGLFCRISPIPMALVYNYMLITSRFLFLVQVYFLSSRSECHLDIPLLDKHTDSSHWRIIFPSKSALLVFCSWLMAPPSTLIFKPEHRN